MSELLLRDEIISHLKASWNTTTKIAWPNKEFDVEKNDGVMYTHSNAWIRLTLITGSSRTTGSGNLLYTTTPGWIVIDLFVRSGTGSRTGYQLGEQAKQIFNYHVFDNTETHCGPSSLEDRGKDSEGPWYRFQVETPFTLTMKHQRSS